MSAHEGPPGHETSAEPAVRSAGKQAANAQIAGWNCWARGALMQRGGFWLLQPLWRTPSLRGRPRRE
eukprot:4464398-Lingulodinium_polyedra.AAC.1